MIRLRWRTRSALYDRHVTVVAMWSGDQERPGAGADGAIGIITLERLISRLFSAGLAIAACRSLVDVTVAPRLDSVIDMLDSMIRDVRQTVFESHSALPSTLAGEAANDPPGIAPEAQIIQDDALLAIIKETSTTVEDLWRVARNDDRHEAAFALGEASQSLHRALMALAESGAYH